MSTPFILRPIATTLLWVAMILLGLIGFRSLPVAPLPNVDFPTIQVTTTYPGASPEVVATAITAPLEYHFGQIAGLTSMTSTSSAGTSQTTLQFALSVPSNTAAQDVQAAINASAGWMPTSLLPSPPTYRQINPADAPVLILAMTSETHPLSVVNEYAQTVMVQKLSQISGVGGVSVEGGQNRAVRVQINPARAAGMGLSLESIRLALAATTTNSPKGSLDGAQQSFVLNANDQLFTATAFSDAILAYRNGAPVRVRDVGRAIDGAENAELAAWQNQTPAVLLNVQRQPGANAIEVADAVKLVLPRLRSSIPPGVQISIIADRTTMIRASIADVETTFAFTTGLVVLVIFVFLRRFWASVIASVALPVSIIATFAVMALWGFSLDNLSLMALTLACGFVVDDAIVMIENITRYIEGGDPPIKAAIKGARQIGFTVVSLTASLVAVFIPLLLMEGLIGRLFSEFAVTLSFAVILSCLVSLTLTPMMCASLIKADTASRRPSRLICGSERAFEAMLAAHVRALDWVLRHRSFTLLLTIAVMVATGWLYLFIPKGFIPEQDTGLLIGTTEAPQDTSFTAMAARQQALTEIIAKDPAVEAVGSFVGAGTVNPTLNSGRLYVNIGMPDKRVSVNAIIRRLEKQAAQVAGISLHLRPAQDLAIEARPTRAQYQYVVQAMSEEDMREWSGRLLAELARSPEFTGVFSDQQDKGLQVMIDVDRAMATRMGITVNAIDQTLYDAFGQRQIAQIFSPITQYRVILEVDPALRTDLAILQHLYVGRTDAASDADVGGVGSSFQKATPQVPLSAFATMTRRTGPLAITHQGLFPAATLSFNLAPGASLGDGVAALQRAEEQIGMPKHVTTNLAGMAAEFVAAQQSQAWLILAAIITVYIVLGVLYESFIHPITILSTLPSAGLGALLALIAAGEALDMMSLIGIILLIGIAKKNAIMMVDFALEAERERGADPKAAVREACILRFRPIMMTTMAALLGALPLALDTGIGSELRRPMGIAIVGGLAISQILTLYTTPIIYLALDRLQRMASRQARLVAAPQERPTA